MPKFIELAFACCLLNILLIVTLFFKTSYICYMYKPQQGYVKNIIYTYRICDNSVMTCYDAKYSVFNNTNCIVKIKNIPNYQILYNVNDTINYYEYGSSCFYEKECPLDGKIKKKLSILLSCLLLIIMIIALYMLSNKNNDHPYQQINDFI